MMVEKKEECLAHCGQGTCRITGTDFPIKKREPLSGFPLKPAALRGEEEEGCGLGAAAGGRRLGGAQLDENGLQRAEPGEPTLSPALSRPAGEGERQIPLVPPFAKGETC